MNRIHDVSDAQEVGHGVRDHFQVVHKCESPILTNRLLKVLQDMGESQGGRPTIKALVKTI